VPPVQGRVVVLHLVYRICHVHVAGTTYREQVKVIILSGENLPQIDNSRETLDNLPTVDDQIGRRNPI
jgi:hypothetical protein